MEIGNAAVHSFLFYGGMLIAVSLFDQNNKRSVCTFVIHSNNFVKFKTYRTWHLH